VNAVDECGGIWNITYPYGGNYWSDYWGDDLYSGPNQDIPGPDGIGDIPYEIPCEHGIDYYPLMHPFELYYILNISAPLEVEEGTDFNVVVTSLGGPAVPDTIVEFNDELKLTDADGRVYFTAPLVEYNTLYNIIATKEGYTDDTERILVRDIPDEFEKILIIGFINNLTVLGDVITFNAKIVLVIKFSPLKINVYKSGELISIEKDYFGIITPRFIFAFCELSYKSPIISMNSYSWDNASNKVIWLVSGVEGNPIGPNDVESILIDESGQTQPDAEITFDDVTGEGYISPGDTYAVVAPSDGNYVFLLSYIPTGEIVFKSVLRHY